MHDDELTYAVVAGRRDGIPRSVSGSYRLLCSGLERAYARLGIEARLSRGRSAFPATSACYLSTTQADLTADGAKLAGSAQVWSADICLQHGSLVRTRDVDAESRALGLTGAAATALARGTTSMADVLGRTPSFEEIAEAVVAGMGEAIGVVFERETFSARELRRASELQEDVPGDDVRVASVDKGIL